MGIIAKHITEVLTPPIEKNPALSIPTNNLIVKMMAKDKNDRFHSWEAVINCIENILSGTVSSDKFDLLQADEFQQIDQGLMADLDQAFPGTAQVKDQKGDGREYW